MKGKYRDSEMQVGRDSSDRRDEAFGLKAEGPTEKDA